MRVLVVGGGGREHALAWRLAQDAEVHAAPGNPGIAEVATCHEVAPTDVTGICELARVLKPDLVVIGPEAPLFAGLADRLRAEGFPVFGPNQDAAQIEGSKAFSKDLMRRAGVPTASAWTESDPKQALELARKVLYSGPVVLKASGPSFARGVVICRTFEDAEATLARWMVHDELGEAGRTVLVEEYLEGREFSLFSLVSGANFRSLPVAQDYKKIFDGDEGPNTGGMGSYSPADWVSADLVRETEARVAAPVLELLARDGIDYRGVLFSGLMASADDLKCLEYNARFGDPETQCLMPRMGKGFVEALLACAKGEPIPDIEVRPHACVCVVLASANYPDKVTIGKPITIDASVVGDALLFHAGTAIRDGELVTAGGRVIGVTATGTTAEEAHVKAYAAAEGVTFEGKQNRSDIGASQN